MKSVSRISGLLLMIILVLSLSPSIDIWKNPSALHPSEEGLIHCESEYIHIEDESDFIDQGWTGSGTEIDPFVLENQGLGIIDEISGIYIRNTSSFFVIRNCQLLRMDIVFWGVSNGRIEDCVFTNSSIILDDSSHIAIVGNELTNSAFGDETIWLRESSDCEISENQITMGFTGIWLIQSNNTLISHNTFTDVAYGAVDGDLGNTTLVHNIFDGTGVRMDFWDAQIDEYPPIIYNNTVNGKDLGIFFNLIGDEIDGSDFGQIILGKCNDTRVIGGSIANSVSGVQLISSFNCSIESMVISDCSWTGINAERSPRIRITDTTISNCEEYAIFMSLCPFYIIEDCTLEENLGGIHPHIYSHNGTVRNCTITGRNPSDSTFFIGGPGLYLSNNATAIGNTITRNRIGITVYGSNCLVVDNAITYNGYGIYMSEIYDGYGEDPNGCRIYGNEIGWNTQGNAFDWSWNYNEWDDGVSIGNAWSDYYGIGYYVIHRDVVDHYPRLLPEGAIPLFYIDVTVGVSVIIVFLGILTIVMKRRAGTAE